jgi:hypothetical protein
MKGNPLEDYYNEFHQNTSDYLNTSDEKYLRKLEDGLVATQKEYEVESKHILRKLIGVSMHTLLQMDVNYLNNTMSYENIGAKNTQPERYETIVQKARSRRARYENLVDLIHGVAKPEGDYLEFLNILDLDFELYKDKINEFDSLLMKTFGVI